MIYNPNLAQDTAAAAAPAPVPAAGPETGSDYHYVVGPHAPKKCGQGILHQFYAPLRVIINQINPQNHFISDLAAHNVYFESRQLLLTPVKVTFTTRNGGEKFCGFSLAVFF